MAAYSLANDQAHLIRSRSLIDTWGAKTMRPRGGITRGRRLPIWLAGLEREGPHRTGGYRYVGNAGHPDNHCVIHSFR